ncbi:hypothetical protein ACHQM5_017186 [Ranunculus cassubicifolius]
MEEIPRLEKIESLAEPVSLSLCNSLRRNNNVTNSPEFEFWMVRNPLFPQPNLLSAEELIVDGVLRPLHLLSQQPEILDTNSMSNEEEKDLQEAEPEPVSEVSHPGPGPESVAVSSASKRWRDIFKKSSVAVEDKEKNKEKEKGKKKDRKSNSNGGVSSAAELNINIWPFSRSWSAGTGGNRSRIGSGGVTRKVSSAPCSRSNSSGESKSRKWPNSPSRGGGIHLGRNSPVWQVRRGASGLRNTEPVAARNVEKVVVQKDTTTKECSENSRRSKNNGGGSGASKSMGLNLNVPMCMGYRQQLSCRRDENILLGGGGGADGSGGCSNNSGSGIGGNKLFYLRTLFTKKVY